jgi:hypothetical protein
MRRLVLSIALVLGCGGKSDEAETKAGDKPGTPTARDAAIEAWKKAGLTASAMTPASVAFGKDCQSGTVNNVDVLVCVYASPAEAKAAEPPALEWVGGTTGAKWSSGSLLVAAADRRKADPSGRTINQLMKLTPK